MLQNTVVIKYGGSSMAGSLSMNELLTQIVQLKKEGYCVILVHGGGKEISAYMKKLDLKPNFIEGLRYTDAETIDVVKMVLAGKVNKELVSIINSIGGEAAGLSGADLKLLECEKKLIKVKDEKIVDGGLIGEVYKVNTKILDILLSNDVIPVIAPLGYGNDGTIYNVNGDDAACAIASALGARMLVFVSDVDGVYKDINDKESKISILKSAEALSMIKAGEINGGMIPKINCSIAAINNGVQSVIITGGDKQNVLYNDVLGNSVTGTIIK